MIGTSADICRWIERREAFRVRALGCSVAFGLLSLFLAGSFLPVSATAAEAPPTVPATEVITNLLGWATNGPAAYTMYTVQFASNTPAGQAPALSAQPEPGAGAARPPEPGTPENGSNSNRVAIIPVFEHYLPQSLNNAVWTNFIAHTNGRTTALWGTRRHPTGWPTNATVEAAWNTKNLVWGMKGMTALSPCWQNEGTSGQVPITALTRRHGYTRGHGMGPDRIDKDLAGQKVWFVAEDNTIVEVKVLRNAVRTAGGSKRDYTILLFDRDLPPSIQPIRVVTITNIITKYPLCPAAPHPVFKTEQSGNISADAPGFFVNTWKAGDSGSPDMLALPGELVFVSGRSTSPPGPEMQEDMDELCRLEKLDPKKYQLQWVDLSQYPSYAQH
jgi:hypothetical protein